DRRKHRIRKTSAVDDAAYAEAVLLIGVARFAAEQAAALLRRNAPGLRRPRRHAAVGWIDHERSAPRVRVVFTPVRDRRARSFLSAGEHIDRREVALVPDPCVFEPFGVLLSGQKRARAELRGALERHAVLAFARPLTMQIGIAPSGAPAPGVGP